MVLTAANNTRLSRRLLWGVILLYILPGLFARAPWKPDDAIGFGQGFYFATHGIQHWSFSQIGDRLFAEEGLLGAWLSGGLGKLALSVNLPWRWLDDTMRISNAVWLILAGWAIWNSAYRLARRVELQPEDPLGTAPTRVDYARSVADASVLCLLATLGLLVRSHMQGAELPELAGLSILLLGYVRSLDRPIGAGWMIGWGLVIAYFARGWSHTLPFLLVLMANSSTHNSLRFGQLRRMMRAALVFGMAFGLWFFWLMANQKGQVWWDGWNHWNANRFLLLDPEKSLDKNTLINAIKTASWFLWPILPMSAWTVWRYRSAFREPALRIPFAATAAGILVVCITNPSEEANYFPLLAPLSVLAALGLSTMRRGLTSLIDWFAVICFTLGAVLVWLGWSAATFGYPAQLARNFERLSPGYVPGIVGLELAMAVLASVAWFRLIVWRTSAGPRALWRPMILSSGGITLIWFLLMTLWIPRINYAKTFQPLGEAVADFVPLETDGKPDCIEDYNLGFAQRATLEYHSQRRFVDVDHNAKNKHCQFLLLQDDTDKHLMNKSILEADNPLGWQLVWAGNRNSDRRERFYLYARH